MCKCSKLVPQQEIRKKEIEKEGKSAKSPRCNKEPITYCTNRVHFEQFSVSKYQSPDKAIVPNQKYDMRIDETRTK